MTVARAVEDVERCELALVTSGRDANVLLVAIAELGRAHGRLTEARILAALANHHPVCPCDRCGS